MRFLVYSISLLFLIRCGSGIIPFSPFNKKESNLNELLLLFLIPQNSYVWNLPPGFPTPVVPASNPMTQEKVDLGRFLFYDRKLSGNQTQSCASCHKQSLAFTDGLTKGIGSTGEVHPRNAQGIINVAYNVRQTWVNPTLKDLEDQMLVPMFGEHPVELGLANHENELLDRLRSENRYQSMFQKAFPLGDPFTVSNVIKAIACFERTLISGRSPYDKYLYDGNISALGNSAQRASILRGAQIFFSEKGECFHCHGGFNFTETSIHSGSVNAEITFHNNGLYNIGGTGDYPVDNPGLFEFTGLASDKGKFRAPSIRNIELTAPYMHDGSIDSLENVVEHYNAGGRNILNGLYAGDGRANPNKNAFVFPIGLTAGEKTDLVNFLKSLTDTEFVNDPKHSNPF
ncbi:di-heme enzyme [Leptospira interrogans]|uniref:Di-heme enzyme, MXAN_0977 family n=3 Tax=Leptospira interrogans TaxID=173 RepID=M6RE75_LEPIR|nr:MbnH family di-heme enzyme [Leptospira interrogans]APH41014.1 Cytochrome c peroxidase [Leptospira interrogans serovar Copenhageni/Icterohaemorrhagiae]EMO06487.1 di-heme enzyme, MXAN_0977 family [Leptospira interrogans serovar Icterohaemorrhagiae str. Verdun HP]OCC27155.1 Di-heme enzyme, MXAN_0977 family [Leptospira interrogans serovar Canicola]AAS69695.1 methylamine utilization protein [Leptospira interrogans serovar Copenhageni str. Fiocruz L1-130]ARB97077.1 di-heme enzyme [Leptospira inte